MYLEHFQLKAKPFQITADPKFLWLGEKHKEGLATLRYGILDNRGFLLLTGEVGTGKTILINQLVSMLQIDTVVATLPDPDLESMDFYNMLADGLRMNRTFDSKGAFLIHLRDFLHQSHAKHKQVLLIIDESQRLNHRLMEDIRVLSNIELHDKKLINIFFVGQQEFNSILLTPQNRALAQRITVRYHIEPLNQHETGDYISHRLKVAGTSRQLFKDSALSEIYEFSSGIPRLINIICDHALLTAYAKGMHQVDEKIIHECSEELRIPFQYSDKETAPEAAQGHVQNPTAIAQASVKAAQSPSGREAGKGPPYRAGAANGMEPAPTRARVWSLVHVAMILALLTIVAFAVTHFTRREEQRWDADDLTPQKYKTTLEQEKEILASRLKEESAKPPAQSAAPSAGQQQAARKPTIPGGASGNDQKAAPPGGDEAAHSLENQAGGLIRPDAKPGSPGSRALAARSGEIEPLPLIREKVLIHFEINSNEIESGSYDLLDSIAGHLILHPAESINVRGYTDSSGSAGYNESVSRFRASAVKSYLAGKGVDADRINIFAMGDVAPMASNDTVEGRRLNRRVEIEFLPAAPGQGATAKPPS